MSVVFAALLRYFDLWARRFGRALGYLFFPLFLYGATRATSESGIATVRIGGLLVFLVLLILAVAAIGTATKRESMATRWRQRAMGKSPGWAMPLVYAASVVLLADGVFSGLTMELINRHLVVLHPRPRDGGQLADFYMWQLLDKLPGDVTGTMRWQAPLEYSDRRVGALVLVYNFLVIAPSLACVALVHVVNVRNAARADTAAAVRRGPRPPAGP